MIKRNVDIANAAAIGAIAGKLTKRPPAPKKTTTSAKEKKADSPKKRTSKSSQADKASTPKTSSKKEQSLKNVIASSPQWNSTSGYSSHPVTGLPVANKPTPPVDLREINETFTPAAPKPIPVKRSKRK